jgi:GNAT superfamily N-acetyltransferase
MIINKLQLIDFKPELSGAFKTLNQWWIESYFVMEKADYELLDHPQEAIIDKGGVILFAMAGKHPVGVCALIKSKIATYDFELAKMGVLPDWHGRGIGFCLGTACLKRAKSLGAKTVFLESNTKLEAAMHLYLKLGFEKIEAFPTPYNRCNIQMLTHL